uniref:Uncharacterized protein n=1 Tax=Anopheles culicifacies TaxID=139723 RepID=A0A182MVB9_9DIPT
MEEKVAMAKMAAMVCRSGVLLDMCQAFLLYEGTAGEPGKSGGQYGLGGEGGKPGEISVVCLEGNQPVNVNMFTKSGADGINGKGGVNGRDGKRGWDMAYLDYAIGRATGNWPKYYGRDKNSCLKLHYYSDSDDDRVYCAYKQEYAGISESRIENTNMVTAEERNNSRSNDEREHDAKAVGRKTISRQRILNAYSEFMNTVEAEIRAEQQKRAFEAQQAAQRAAQQAAQRAAQQAAEMELEQTIITNSVESSPNTIHRLSTAEEARPGSESVKEISHIHSPEEAQCSGSIVEIQNDESLEENVPSSEHSIEELRLATLKRHVPSQSVSEHEHRHAKVIVRALDKVGPILKTDKVFSVLDDWMKLNTEVIDAQNLQQLMDRFAAAQQLRNALATFVKQELMLDNIALHRAMKTFVLETEYSDLLYESAENLQNELKKPQHKNLYRFWDGMYDRPLENEVKAMIENDYTLKILYDRWNDVKRRISQYELEPLSVTEDAKAKFITYIRSKGVMAECCRELLAYAFNVNLRVYGRDEDDELILREDRNPSSCTQNHILARGKEFVQLTINEEYTQLAKERLHNDMNYSRILRDMDTLNSINQINNYLDNSCIKPQGRFGMVEETHIDEKLATETIASYFPEEERNKLKVVLEKVAFEYSNQKRILQQILQRFSYEGRDISFNEMCFFVNAVLENFDDCDQDEYTYAWIAAAYCQRNWVDEVILLQLETYFKKPLDETRQWREYMGKIKNKEVLLVFVTELQACECSVECVDEILYLLSSVPIESMSFEGIPLTEWSYFLKEHYWMVQLRHLADTCSLKWSKDESLEDATYYIRSVENIFGKYKANDLLDKIRAKKVKINAGQLFDILRNLYKQNWKLSDEDIRSLAKLSLQEWTVQMKAKHKPIVEELKIEQLTQIVENDEISSEEIINQLPEIRTAIQRISSKMISYDQKSVALFTEHEIKEWAKAFRSKVNRRIVQRHLQTYEQMLAVVDRAIEIRRGFRLRDTQRLSVLILLSNKRSTLAQVSTGEGKSLIVVALSLIKALFSEKVDIVTSSSVLAKRDSDVNKDIYQLFDIDVSHNCSENIEERKEAYSLHPVVYGDLANFQRDYLLDRFYGKNILGDRDFTNVLVDEVDSMLLDKGNNMLYLSHDIPGMDKLESLYICIWQMVNSSMERPEAIDIEAMEMDILSNLYNSITPDDLMELDAELGFRKLNIIWNCLVDGGIMNDEGHLITDNIDSAKMEQILTPEVVQYKHRLSFLLKECVNREKPFKVPNNLKKFVERHLSAWIASALNALLMVPGQSYVVSRNKSGAKDRNASIVILDNDTGADQGSSQWDEALHQFLQLKHGCKLSMQSLKAVFVSNVSYFKKYKLLYGLTGTLGSQRERNLLKDIHQVAFVTIPTAKSKQFKEYKPIINRGYRMWLRNIKTEVTKLINEENRSVLIICDTINNAEAICITLKDTFGKNVHSYTRDYQEFDVVQGNQQLQQGQIIIATNLAGRGTDIRITDTLRQNGGLHVLLTYLPENIRIEEQAFGRAARSGDKGSGQLLIMVSSQRQYSRSKILELKKRRDQNELYRIAEIKTYYEKTIKAEEICFEEFKQVYEKHRKRLDAANVPAEVKTILLQTCLDRWAFWLDEYSGSMEDVMKDCNARKVPTLLMQLLSGINDFRTGELDNVEASSILDFNIESWKVWVEGNPMQMVKLANYITQTCFTKSVWQKVKSTVNPLNFLTEAKIRAAYKAAMSLYDEVIETEPQFSEAAYYYRAYTLMKTVEHEETTQSKANKQRIKDFKQDLRAAKKLFEDHYAFALQASSIVSKLRRNQDWYDDYQKQNDTISQFYQTFIRSIEDILGHAVTASTFVNDEIKEELAEFIFNQLIEAGTLRSPKVRKTISEKQLYTIQSDYCISINALRQFLLAKAGPIDEEDFLKECSVEIPLASRERFWESLITQNVLNCIQKYAIIDNVKLAKVDPSLKAALDAKVTDKTLIVESITPAADQIVLYYEELSLANMEPSKDDPKSPKVYIFEKDNFIRLIGGERFALNNLMGQLKEDSSSEEELLFTLNGLQYRLHLQEKKWSKTMLFSVGVVVGIGIAQIITAAVMEIYSAGAFTHVASGLINEGINDIMYAVNSFKSGYFSWKDYGIEKIKNVVLSGITVGVGAYASRGTKVSRIGKKVAGPGLIEDAKELSTLTGAALKKSRAGDKIFGETMKRIVCKTAQGFAQGAASAMVDTFTDDYLQSVINSIAGEVLAAAVSQVDGDKLSQTLRRIYDELGEQQARKLILQLSDFESNGWETSISYMKQFKSSLAQGFANAMKKTGNNNNKLNEKCKTMTRDPSLHEQQNANDFETFRHEIVSQWKKQLGDCVGRMITQHFVKPLLNDALIRAGKFATRIPHNVKRIALNRKMKKLKKKYDKAVNDPSATDAIKDSLKKDYHTKLEKIMYKTKSPALFAKIIEENVKMDLTCAAACAPLVHALMKQMGIKVNGIVLNVQLENGAEQSFSSGSPEGADVRQVVLHLKGNHFTFSGNDQDVANNNCMFAAMCDAIPELSVIDADKFRKQIANTIRHEPDVQHRIRQGWHRFPIKHYNAIGGKQITMPRKDAPQRAYHNDSVKAFRANLINYQASENFKQSESPSFHLVSRVSITSFEIAGAISAIMEVTGLEFEDIIDMEKGSSTTKDDIPVVKGNEIQRAHTTRGTIKSGGKFDEYPELKTKLQHYFAHREYVVKEANQYKRVAGSIDDNQMEWVREIIKDHTFSKPPSHNTVSNIQTHLLKTKTVVNKRFTKGKKPYSELMVSEMEVFDKSISKVAESEVDCKTIYESGQFGYSTIMEGVNKAPNVYVRKSKSNSEQKKKKKML